MIILQDDDDSSPKVPIIENSYCKAVGSVRSYQGKRNLVVFSITQLDNLNRLTTHILEVIHFMLKDKQPKSMVR